MDECAGREPGSHEAQFLGRLEKADKFVAGLGNVDQQPDPEAAWAGLAGTLMRLGIETVPGKSGCAVTVDGVSGVGGLAEGLWSPGRDLTTLMV